MEENEYRDGYRAINDRPCRFEKALLTRCADCSRARRLNLAEREAVGCDDASGWERCGEWLALLRPRAQFALQLVNVAGPLPHGKEMKVQCGGLQGLQAQILPEAEPQVTDVAGLLAAAVDRHGALEVVPLQEVIKHIAQYRLRRRSR